MIAAISPPPEGYAFIVAALLAICTVTLFILVAAASTELNRYRARRRFFEEVERFRDELDAERDLVKAIGRVPVDDRRWAA